MDSSPARPRHPASSGIPHGHIGYPQKQVGALLDRRSSPFSLSSSPAQTSSSGLPPVKYQEMSPEVTLVEFISTSAAFHGVKKQNIKQLEWDILKVLLPHKG